MRTTIKTLAFAAITACASSAFAATATDSFQVRINILPSCDASVFNGVGASDIDFGDQLATATSPALTENNQGATNFAVKCSAGHAVSVTLAPGNVPSTSGAGVMKHSDSSITDTVSYQLKKPKLVGSSYQASDTEGNWGSASADALTVTGQGTSVAINLPVTAVVPANSLDKRAGQYADTVTATLTY